jgi:hypothetical protein
MPPILSFKKFNREKISWVVAIEVAVIVVVLTFFLPGGNDLFNFYYKFARGCLECAYALYYTQWLLWPLTLLPIQWVWPAVIISAVFVVLAICRYTKVNPIFIFLSFPFFAQLWLGQIDFIEMGGLALALMSSSPYLRGAGIVLALIKPQVTLLGIAFLLTKEDPKDYPKVLAVPVAVLAISMLVYGVDWPIAWINHVVGKIPLDPYRLASNMVWPLGILLIWVPVLFKDRRERLEVALLISSIATPFYGVYYYTNFLIFRSSWWTLLLSYAWVLFYPLMGLEALKYAWVLPAAMLVEKAYHKWVRGKQEKETPSTSLQGQ